MCMQEMNGERERDKGRQRQSYGERKREKQIDR